MPTIFSSLTYQYGLGTTSLTAQEQYYFLSFTYHLLTLQIEVFTNYMKLAIMPILASEALLCENKTFK